MPSGDPRRVRSVAGKNVSDGEQEINESDLRSQSNPVGYSEQDKHNEFTCTAKNSNSTDLSGQEKKEYLQNSETSAQEVSGAAAQRDDNAQMHEQEDKQDNTTSYDSLVLSQTETTAKPRETKSINQFTEKFQEEGNFAAFGIKKGKFSKQQSTYKMNSPFKKIVKNNFMISRQSSQVGEEQ